MIRLIVLSFFLSACAVSQDMNPDVLQSKLQSRLKSMAGENAVSCGIVAIKANTQAANDCAQDAFRRGRPFYISYQEQGIDSAVTVALVMTSLKKLLWLQSDSMGFSGPFGKAVAEEKNHIIVEPCPKPYQLNVDRLEQLSCFSLPTHGKEHD